MLAVCVDFEINLASLDAFLIIVEKNASDSLANAVGCHQFDIAQDPQNPTTIFLYGLYDDVVAFELHKKASHYLEFNDAISGMVNKKSIRLFQKINHQFRAECPQVCFINPKNVCCFYQACIA